MRNMTQRDALIAKNCILADQGINLQERYIFVRTSGEKISLKLENRIT